MENRNELVTLLNLIMSNQQKIMAANRVQMAQSARLIAALTKAKPEDLLEEFRGLYLQELEQLQLEHLEELGDLSRPRRKPGA
jgi:hypothetical protein